VPNQQAYEKSIDGIADLLRLNKTQDILDQCYNLYGCMPTVELSGWKPDEDVMVIDPPDGGGVELDDETTLARQQGPNPTSFQVASVNPTSSHVLSAATTEEMEAWLEAIKWNLGLLRWQATQETDAGLGAADAPPPLASPPHSAPPAPPPLASPPHAPPNGALPKVLTPLFSSQLSADSLADDDTETELQLDLSDHHAAEAASARPPSFQPSRSESPWRRSSVALNRQGSEVQVRLESNPRPKVHEMVIDGSHGTGSKGAATPPPPGHQMSHPPDALQPQRKPSGLQKLFAPADPVLRRASLGTSERRPSLPTRAAPSPPVQPFSPTASGAGVKQLFSSARSSASSPGSNGNAGLDSPSNAERMQARAAQMDKAWEHWDRTTSSPAPSPLDQSPTTPGGTTIAERRASCIKPKRRPPPPPRPGPR
jgi:hypothetical protein